MAKVKPLEWKNSVQGTIRASAFGIDFFYHIRRDPDGQWELRSPGYLGYQHNEGFETQASAKRFATADYELRVLAALDLDD